MSQSSDRCKLLVPEMVPFRIGCKKSKNHQDKIAYFVSLVSRRQASNKAGWVHISRAKLSQVLTTHSTTNVIKDSISGKIIERSNDYKRRVQSYGYRLTREYLRQDLIEYRCQSSFFREKLLKIWGEDAAAERNEYDEIHRILESHLRRFSINEREAIDSATAYAARRFADDEDGRLASLMSQRFSIGAMNGTSGRRYLKVGSTGRVYTPICSMKQEVRKHLTVDGGKPVDGFDVRSSQPVILYVLLKSLSDPGFGWFGYRGSHVRAEKIGTPLFHIPSNVCSEYDLTFYRSVVETYDLYGYIVEQAKAKEKIFLTRDEAKLGVLKDVFAKKGSYRSDVENVFRRCFPGVYRAIRMINAPSYKRLIRLLQFAESEIVLRGVGERIAELNKDAPFTTLHDSVYVGREHSGLVIEAFSDLSREVGVSIALHCQAGTPRQSSSPALLDLERVKGIGRGA